MESICQAAWLGLVFGIAFLGGGVGGNIKVERRGFRIAGSLGGVMLVLSLAALGLFGCFK